MLYVKATSGGDELALPLGTQTLLDALRGWYGEGLGTLRWPVVGAARWATGLFCIGGYELNLLRSQLGSANAVTLGYRDAEDASDTARTFPLFLRAAYPVHRDALAALPVAEPGVDDLYLLDLVDVRYYWNLITGSGLTDRPADWPALFTALFGRVGASYSMDAVDADYTAGSRRPTERWYCREADTNPVGFLLDYAAACVGSRIVTTPTGGTTVQRPSGANRTVATAWHAANKAADRHRAGGLLDPNESLRGIPKTVEAHWENGSSETTTVALGVAGQTQVCWHDAGGRDTAGQLTAQLAQWAADYYAWADKPLEAVYAGFVTPPHSGFVGDCLLVHDAGRGYTQVSKPDGWGSPPEWNPDPIRAVLTGGYAGAAGYPWDRDQWFPTGPASDTHALPLNDNQDLLAGFEVLLEPFGFGGPWAFVAPPVAGCGLLFDGATNTLSVDVAQLAGTGLSTEVAGDCLRLRVDAGYLPGAVTLFGCGLTYDGVSTLDLDLTGVVTAPLTWSGCSLGLDLGCGLVTPGGALTLDVATLVGDACDTGLVTTGNPCEISTDRTPFTTTVETEYGRVFAGPIAGALVIRQDFTEYTNTFNCSGELIDRTVTDSGTIDVLNMDLCLFDQCCTATSLSVVAGADDETPVAGQSVAFTSTPAGGVPPYTYAWDFDDGGTSTSANPSHTFAAAGTYDVVLTVTDACGRTATDHITITVSEDLPVCADLADTLYLTLSATGDCAGADGTVITLERVGASNLWAMSSAAGGTCSVTSASFNCDTLQAQIVFGAANTTGDTDYATSSTSPLNITFDFTVGGVEECCLGSITGVLTDV